MGRCASGKYVYKPGDTKHLHTWRTCTHCGTDYLGRVDSNSRYCSLDCSNKANGKRRRLTATQECHLVCVKCSEEKPEASFARSSRSETGRKSRCRACIASDWQASRTPEILARRRKNGKQRWRADPEAMRARAREQMRRWREANWGRERAVANARYRVNPEPRKNSEKRRRAQKLSVPVLNFTDAQLAARWEFWAGRCWICGGDADTWDHVKPLAKGGSHILANLRPACRPCNCRKHARWPYSPQR